MKQISQDVFDVYMKLRASAVRMPYYFREWQRREGFTDEEIKLIKSNWKFLRKLLNPPSAKKFQIRMDDEIWLEPLLRIFELEYKLSTRQFKKKPPKGEPLRYALAKVAYVYGLLDEDWEVNLKQHLERLGKQ